MADGVYYPDERVGQTNDDRTSAFTLKADVATDNEDKNAYTFASLNHWTIGNDGSSPTALRLHSFATSAGGRGWAGLLIAVVWSFSAGVVGWGGCRLVKKQS